MDTIKTTKPTPLANAGRALSTLASEWQVIDPPFFDQLDTLGRDLTGGRIQPWLYVDLDRKFDLGNLHEVGSDKLRRLPWLSAALRAGLMMTTVLLLGLTLAGTWVALQHYQFMPAVGTEGYLPLIQYWIRGQSLDMGLTLPDWAQLDVLLLIDAAGAAVAAVLIGAIASWESYEKGRVNRSIQQLRAELTHHLGKAGYYLAQKRYAHEYDRVQQLREDAREMLDGLREARTQSEALVAQREQEVVRLTAFAENLVTGGETLLRFADEGDRVFRRVEDAAAHVADATSMLTHQQATMASLVEGTQARLASMTEGLGEAIQMMAATGETLSAGMRLATAQTEEAVGVNEALGDLSTRLLEDYTGLRRMWQEDREAQAALVDDLHQTAQQLKVISTTIERSLAQLDRIDQHLKATLHLSAQITDDLDRRESEERDWSAHISDITTELHEVVGGLDHHAELSASLLNRLAEEGATLSATWAEGHHRWLAQIDEAAERTAGTLRAQGMEIHQTGDAVREGLDQITAASERLAEGMAAMAQVQTQVAQWVRDVNGSDGHREEEAD
jgi:uncharacterized protein